MTRLQLILAVVLACGLLATGCGGDDDDGGDQADAPAVTETTPLETTPDDTTAPADEPDAEDVPEVSEGAVEACKESLESAAGISEDQVEELCEAGGSGDEEAVRETSIEICREFAENNIPEGTAREQALEQCDRAGEE